MKRFKKVLLTLGVTGMVSLSSAFLISCDKDKVSLSFDTNGGASISDVKVNSGAEYTLPVPEREGYRFDGWYVSDTFEGEAVEKIVASGNVTYYAKWTQVYAVNLDVNGGELDDTKIYLAQGDNVYEAVKDLVPQKAGLTFGAWFIGNNELSKSTTMKSEALTLVAGYKVGYTVEIYQQNLTDDEYTKTETLTGSEYVGKQFTSSQKQTGFTEVSEESSLTKTLSANASENVFKHYFDRNVCTVTFNPNYPGVESPETSSVTAKYGEKVEIPSDPTQYAFEGYCLLGWTTSTTSSKVEFPANLDELLYNASGDAENLEYTVERTTTLYGVWQKGYTDMFGGNDYIYYLEGGEDIYLCRGNVYFKGEFNAKKSEFYFDDENGKEVLSGKLYESGKYVYYSESRAKTSVLYKVGEGIVETTKIRFDTYNGITYTVYSDSNAVLQESTGTYEIVSGGEYLATFTAGTLKGKTLNFLLGTVTNEDGGSQSAFQVRNDDEYQIGKIVMMGVLKTNEDVYDIGYGSTYFELDGFGTAKLVSASGSRAYNYTIDEDGNVHLTDANDNPVETIRLIDVPGSKDEAKGYMVYTAEMDDEFAVGTNATLTLDGLYNAVYKKNGVTVESYYTSYQSPMGGTIVSIIDKADKKEYKFLFTPQTETVEGDDGETTVTTYTAKSVLNTYAEYYYKDGKSLYYAPMLVIDETEKGKASVYGYTAEKTFVKVSEGTYELGTDGLYLYTATEFFDAEEAYSEPIDLTAINSFVFALDTHSTGYSVNYWYSSNDGETNYYVDYENTDVTSEATLKLVAGFAFYKASASATVVTGAYSQSNNILTLKVEDETYYFSVDEENKKFTVLQYVPYSAYLMNTDNTYNQKVYLSFDGLGGAVYTVASETDGGTDTTISGTISVVKVNQIEKETLFGERVYKFTPNDPAQADKAFEYVCVTIGSRTYYALANEMFEAGKYFSAASSAVSGTLTIDGYCYWAEFVSGEDSYAGVYYVGEDVIVLLADNRTFYFDVLENGDFTVRGEEYGLYALYDNQYSNGVFVELDGYGNLTAYTLGLKNDSSDEYERKYLSTEGEYEIDGDTYTLTYATGTEAKAYVCVLNGLRYVGVDEEVYKGFTISKDVAKKVFVDTSDWSVLILDEFGRATKYDKDGQRQVGQYTLITDALLYFVNSGATDACIYEYDVESGEATPVKLEAKSYYTEDLRSLYFSKYGFAVFNGNEDDLYFYNYEGDNVVIYRRGNGGEQTNAYGFVKDDFGLLAETKEYGGDTYYRNYGTDIIFTRAEAETEKYPLILDENTKWYLTDLQFSPSGGAEFSVNGKATFEVEATKDGQTSKTTTKKDCTVTRVVNDDVVEMYVTIEGAYRFYITASYTGEGEENPYSVTQLRYVSSFPAYRYLDVLFRIYYMYGAASANAYKNEFGTITIEIDYDDKGAEIKSSMKAELGEAAELFDLDGNLISFEESKFRFLDNGLGEAEFEAQDGYTYRYYFAISRYPYLSNAYGYYTYALVRLQELEAGDYVVTVGRTVATEAQGVVVGDVYSVGLKKNGEAINAEEFFYSNGKLTYVVRERDGDGYVTKATYYTIDLEENESGSVGDKETIATYRSATVTPFEATILCEKDPEDSNETYKGKDRYVEIVDGEVKVLNLVANKRYAKTSTYDEATGVYTVETTDGRTYYVKIVGENVVIADDLADLPA